MKYFVMSLGGFDFLIKKSFKVEVIIFLRLISFLQVLKFASKSG